MHLMLYYTMTNSTSLFRVLRLISVMSAVVIAIRNLMMMMKRWEWHQSIWLVSKTPSVLPINQVVRAILTMCCQILWDRIAMLLWTNKRLSVRMNLMTDSMLETFWQVIGATPTSNSISRMNKLLITVTDLSKWQPVQTIQKGIWLELKFQSFTKHWDKIQTRLLMKLVNQFLFKSTIMFKSYLWFIKKQLRNQFKIMDLRINQLEVILDLQAPKWCQDHLSRLREMVSSKTFFENLVATASCQCSPNIRFHNQVQIPQEHHKL